jgi:hypothetical protein
VAAERGLGHARHAGDTAIGKATQFLTLYQLSPRQQALPLAQLMAQEEQQLEQQQAEAQAAAQPLTALVADDLSASWKVGAGGALVHGCCWCVSVTALMLYCDACLWTSVP